MTNPANPPHHVPPGQVPQSHVPFQQFQQPVSFHPYPSNQNHNHNHNHNHYSTPTHSHQNHHNQLSPRNSHSDIRKPSQSHSISNYTTSSASSMQRSPSIGTRGSFSGGPVPHVGSRNSFSESVGIPSPSTTSPSLSNEQIIDLMEREQDAIVLKLMKEIDSLKQENKSLKTGGGSVSSASSSSLGSGPNNNVRRSSSLSSNHRNSMSSIVTSGAGSSQQSPTASHSNINGPTNTNKRNSALFANYSVAPPTSNDEMYKKFKSASIDSVGPSTLPRDTSPQGRPNPRSRNSSMSSYDQVWEENKHLKVELMKLKQELDLLKRR